MSRVRTLIMSYVVIFAWLIPVSMANCRRDYYYDELLTNCQACTDCGVGRPPMRYCTEQCGEKAKCKWGTYYDGVAKDCQPCTNCQRTPDRFCIMCTESEIKPPTNVSPPTTSSIFDVINEAISTSAVSNTESSSSTMIIVGIFAAIVVVSLVLCVVMIVFCCMKGRRGCWRTGSSAQPATDDAESERLNQGEYTSVKFTNASNGHHKNGSPFHAQVSSANGGGSMIIEPQPSDTLANCSHDSLRSDYDRAPVAEIRLEESASPLNYNVRDTGALPLGTSVSLSGMPVCQPVQDDPFHLVPSTVPTDDHISLDSGKENIFNDMNDGAARCHSAPMEDVDLRSCIQLRDVSYNDRGGARGNTGTGPETNSNDRGARGNTGGGPETIMKSL